MYDYVIVTHLPAFYKVNLYNELAKKSNIFVVFVSSESNERRSADFVSIQNVNFEFAVLNENEFQNRNKFISLCKLFSMVRKKSYKKLLLSGWDLPEFWMLAFFSPNNKNCLALESTVIESNTQGIRGRIKKAFLTMINTVFASGDLHVELLKKLNYKKTIKVTRGVGIINKPTFEHKKKRYQRKFMFIGRLSKVKNLETLVRIFNHLPDSMLTIIGEGEEKENLQGIANNNIHFLGAIDNSKIKDQFELHDVFILPSISETWGLVVEEALYFGLPVIISENCGASELVVNHVNGFIVDPYNEKQISEVIQQIDQNTYARLLLNISAATIEEKDKLQIGSYKIV